MASFAAAVITTPCSRCSLPSLSKPSLPSSTAAASSPFRLSLRPLHLSPFPCLRSRFVVACAGDDLGGDDSEQEIEVGGGDIGDDGGESGGGKGGAGGGGAGGGGGGEGEDNSEKKEKMGGMSMSQKLTLGYAVLIGAGGVMGYMKSGSKNSLAAGGLTSLMLYYVYTQLPTNPSIASAVGLGVSGALFAVMGSRFRKSGKVFPAGVVSLVSLVMAGGYFHGILRSG